MFLKKIFDLIFIKKYRNIKNIINLINSNEKILNKLTDKELKNKTNEFKNRIKNGENIYSNKLISDSFSVVKESSKRIFGIKHFDVQLLGGLILHNNAIAEMYTGEGKTLTSTLPAYLNALDGNGVHIVTVNEYLAKRDAEYNKLLFDFLGLKVGINLSNMSIYEKKDAYYSDITYGTNYEFCFDYLKDNLVLDLNDKVQRKLNYAIIDEIDSILIDEARVPLIISEKNKIDVSIYLKINNLVIELININKLNNNKYFLINFKEKIVDITDDGFILIENLLIKYKFIKYGNLLYINENLILIEYIISSIKSYKFFNKNVDYILKNKKIILIDEHTGRLSIGKRLSNSIHQFIEAKENVDILCENKNLAYITFQSYFKLYNKISGMTGTASTEKDEFKYIYNLDIFNIPTNKPIIRKDLPDLFFVNEKDKIKKIINDVILCIKNNRPVLIGTISIEKSELISKYLNENNINHQILNAKNHNLEAKIISFAGRPGSVTIATNMAGRGTNIVLGGCYLNKDDIEEWKINNIKVINSGGLHIIGTERHESRRIDNQLIGRSGRQGDPGSSRFYLSLEDNLIKNMLPNNILDIIKNLKLNDDLKNNSILLSKIISNIQKKIEKNNFEIRKQIFIYDDIFNIQRNTFYFIRNSLLNKNINIINNFIFDSIKYIINLYKFNNIKNEIDDLKLFFKKNFNIDIIINENNKKLDIKDSIFDFIKKELLLIEKLIDKKKLDNMKISIFINTLDSVWTEHINFIDFIKKGIYLRSYANRDPFDEYKNDSFEMFVSMIKLWKYKSTLILYKTMNLINNE
ncbi:protein translocase subunit SecA [endosymbiont of Sipalinus gigas]|uniref:preprotein translocase subunit SecA n=1 Tax=endosymbiont of Sipalinus gigas TaxID=1972134 RepID=UPI000DC719D7|nr:preprotein translocase subunit SecA [endosymbiont of Sipalinus gigas]BBA85183.1 protein translocase subunit SecA [endosymbiont of Sipalinus gigas]